MLYQALDISPKAIIGEASELVPESAKLVASLILLALSINPLYTQVKSKLAKKQAQTVFMSDFPVVPPAVPVHVYQEKHGHKSHCGCGK